MGAQILWLHLHIQSSFHPSLIFIHCQNIPDQWSLTTSISMSTTMSATMPCHHANHNVGHIIGRLINVLYIRHHVRHIVGHQDSRLVGNLVNLFVQHHVHYVSYIVDHLVNIQYPCPPPCHLVNSWHSTPTQTSHCQAISCFGCICLLFLILWWP